MAAAEQEQQAASAEVATIIAMRVTQGLLWRMVVMARRPSL